MTGHTRAMGAAATLGRLDVTSDPEVRPRSVLRLADVYEEHFDFVWRSARRMGVAGAAVDDVVQEVFLVAHRRLAARRLEVDLAHRHPQRPDVDLAAAADRSGGDAYFEVGIDVGHRCSP